MEPPAEADTEGTQSVASGDNTTVTPEEDNILSGGQAHTEDQSPRSDTTSVARDMAWLQVHTPPHEEPEEVETSK